MSKSPSTSLRFRLMALVIVAILPIFGLMMRYAVTERNRQLCELREDAVRLADLSAGNISLVLEGTRQMLLCLTRTEPVLGMNGTAAQPLFADLLRVSNDYLNIGMVQPDGLIIGSALPMKEAVYVSDRSYFNRLFETKNFSVSEFLIGKITGKPSINLGLPILCQPGKQAQGIVFASLDLTKLQDCISQVPLPHDGVILVTDRNGIYVARNPGADQWIGKPSRSWAALHAKETDPNGFVEATGVDGITRIYHYAPVKGSDNGLFVAVGVSKSAVLAKSLSVFLNILFWLGCWTGASILATWFFADVSVLKHVRRLTAASRRLAGGDWNASVKVKGGAREIQQLGESFDAMASVLRQHNAYLEAEVLERTLELTNVNSALKEEIAERRRAESALHAKGAEHRKTIEQLTEALAQIKTLNGLLPICSGCKKIRDDKGYWSQIESYITAHSGAQFTHGLCPDCTKNYFPELDIKPESKRP